jgi:hypothetical protein
VIDSSPVLDANNLVGDIFIRGGNGGRGPAGGLVEVSRTSSTSPVKDRLLHLSPCSAVMVVPPPREAGEPRAIS